MFVFRMVVKFIAFLSLLHLVLSQEIQNVTDTLIENVLDVDPIDRSIERVGLLINCGSVGGTCMAGSEADKKCRGAKIEENTCDAKKSVCCINGCQEKYGFFKHYGQCFKFFDIPSTWSEAKQICEENGLVLARPEFELIKLRNYLILRYGVNSNLENKRVFAWLDAVGNGTCMRWNHGTPGCISKDLPLWPGTTNTQVGQCLFLLSTANYWNIRPDAAIGANSCTGFNLFPLCELVTEYE